MFSHLLRGKKPKNVQVTALKYELVTTFFLLYYIINCWRQWKNLVQEYFIVFQHFRDWTTDCRQNTLINSNTHTEKKTVHKTLISPSSRTKGISELSTILVLASQERTFPEASFASSHGQFPKTPLSLGEGNEEAHGAAFGRRASQPRRPKLKTEKHRTYFHYAFFFFSSLNQSSAGRPEHFHQPRQSKPPEKRRRSRKKKVIDWSHGLYNEMTATITSEEMLAGQQGGFYLSRGRLSTVIDLGVRPFSKWLQMMMQISNKETDWNAINDNVTTTNTKGKWEKLIGEYGWRFIKDTVI